MSPPGMATDHKPVTANTAYEIRVRMIPPAGSTHIYRWGYARVYTTN